MANSPLLPKERAQNRSKDLNNVTFVVGDALELDFKDKTFDSVLSFASIKHWPNKKSGLDECRRVLKDRGFFLIMDANIDASPEAILSFVGDW